MQRAYTIALVEKCENRLAFYDAETGALEDTLALPDYPHELARDPDGRTAYIGHYGALNSADPAPGGNTVFVIDLIAKAITSRIDFGLYRRLHGLQCDAAGRLYVLSEAQDVLMTIDAPKAATRPDRVMPTSGVKGHLVVVSTDGRTVFCSNLASDSVTRVAPHDESIPPLVIKPGSKPEGMCLSADEKRLLVLNRGDGTLAEIDAASGDVLRRVTLRGEATRIYRIGADRFLLASYVDESLSCLDANTLRETGYLQLGGRVTAASLHRDLPHAFASLETNELVRVDLTDFTEVSRFRTGRDPDVSTIVVSGIA